MPPDDDGATPAAKGDEGSRISPSPVADALASDYGLSCSISWLQGSEVAVTIENYSDADISILTRGTPWDNATRAFSLRREGERLRYTGPVALRLPPSDSEFQHLAPGGAMTVNYDLDRSYEVGPSGVYSVALSSPILLARVNDVSITLQHDCGELVTQLQRSELGTLEQAISFPAGGGCTSQESAKIEREDVFAARATLFADITEFGYLDPIYARWFGNQTTNRLAFVTQTIHSIATRDSFDTYLADCRQDVGAPGDANYIDCQTGSSVAAWASAGSDFVHFCGNWLDGGAGSLFSQIGPGLASIIIHEKSHNEDSTILDYVYGPVAAKAFAVSDPYYATRNADSYGFYIADTYNTRRVLVPSVLRY